jgi:hypothetical protein
VVAALVWYTRPRTPGSIDRLVALKIPVKIVVELGETGTAIFAPE